MFPVPTPSVSIRKCHGFCFRMLFGWQQFSSFQDVLSHTRTDTRPLILSRPHSQGSQFFRIAEKPHADLQSGSVLRGPEIVPETAQETSVFSKRFFPLFSINSECDTEIIPYGLVPYLSDLKSENPQIGSIIQTL